ncbi:hypothetical protein A4R44_06232 [Amycolatopsis sp. M39]|nr:hypothetical protein [Amycolatopsis rubida]OAP22771.1 hypothetical protein A4R44_06232 [Amycolatopsis sp. M39]
MSAKGATRFFLALLMVVGLVFTPAAATAHWGGEVVSDLPLAGPRTRSVVVDSPRCRGTSGSRVFGFAERVDAESGGDHGAVPALWWFAPAQALRRSLLCCGFAADVLISASIAAVSRRFRRFSRRWRRAVRLGRGFGLVGFAGGDDFAVAGFGPEPELAAFVVVDLELPRHAAPSSRPTVLCSPSRWACGARARRPIRGFPGRQAAIRPGIRPAAVPASSGGRVVADTLASPGKAGFE